MAKTVRSKKRHGFFETLWRYKWLYLMLVPVIVYFLLFRYLPMYGLTIAFEDYNIFHSLFNQKFVGFKVFKKVFANINFWASIKNTLFLNLMTLVVNFPLTIIVSLILNEIRSAKFKRVTQSVLYLPHFISWVVVAGIATNLFSTNGGTINNIILSLGGEAKSFYGNTYWWTVMYIALQIWKEIGWGTIIYLAALTGVDEQLYEAAYLDGATRFQRIIHITLPMIKSVVVVMLILSISRMMSIGLDAPLLLGNTAVMSISEVISTYVYRLGIVKADYPQSTAIGLFQSVVNIIVLLLADRFAKAIGEGGIL